MPARKPATIDPFGGPPEAAPVRAGVGRNVLATGAGNVVIQLLQFASFVILARLLAPDDYGVLAMVAATIGLAELFRDMGLTAATVRMPTITREQVNSIYWINTGLGALMTTLAFFAAPGVGELVRDPRAEEVTRVMAFGFVIGGMSAQHLALMRRSLRFVELVRMRMLASLLAVVVSLAMAFAGMGYWALVAAALVKKVAMLVQAMLYSGWQPQRPGYDPSVKPMLTFGGHLIVFGFLSYCASNLQFILLGRYWGGAEVGLFNRAKQVMGVATGRVLAPIRGVAPPTLARLHTHPREFADFYRTTLQLMMLVLVPACFWIYYLAEILVAVLLGDQWTRAAEVIKAMAPGMVPGAIVSSSGWLFLARGNSAAMLRWGLVGWPVVILCKVIGLQWGAPGVAAMGALSSYLVLLPCMSYAMRGTELRLLDLWLVMRKPVAGTVPAILAVLLLEQLGLIPQAMIPRGIIVTAVYGGIYLTLLLTVLGERERLFGLARRALNRGRPKRGPKPG